MATGEQRLKVEPGARNVIGESVAGRLEIVPLSVEQYDRMIEDGILAEDAAVELLDGILVRKDRGDAGGDAMTVGETHAYVVTQLAYLGLRLDPAVMHLRTQQPIVIPEAGEPEPDAAIIRRPITTIEKPRAEHVQRGRQHVHGSILSRSGQWSAASGQPLVSQQSDWSPITDHWPLATGH